MSEINARQSIRWGKCTVGAMIGHFSTGLVHPRRPARRAMAVAIAILLAGLHACTVGPDFVRPEPDMPDRWHGDLRAVASPERPGADQELATWWAGFHDPVLSTLVERAAVANLDLKQAEARIRQARAALAVAAGGLGPGLAASAAYQRRRTATVTGDHYQAGFDAGWEIDLFGGRRRTVEAAQADLQAAVESRRDVLVSLMAEVARDYIQLRAYQRQIAITRQNLAAQRHSANLTRARFNAGFVSGLDVATAEAQTATTAAQIPLLESAARQTIYGISVLLGQAPAALEEELSPTGAIPGAPPVVPLGIPSELLRRRPDIRLAEANIHAATARIGAAAAELFPKFTIGGSVGVQAADPGALVDAANRFWSLGPALTWRLFESGSLRAGVEVQTALQEQALIVFRQTVLKALQEVENALVASVKEQARHDALMVAVSANRRAVVLANRQYVDGLSDFINVLQAQQALNAAENALAQSTAAVSTDLVALFKALGGGWTGE